MRVVEIGVKTNERREGPIVMCPQPSVQDRDQSKRGSGIVNVDNAERHVREVDSNCHKALRSSCQGVHLLCGDGLLDISYSLMAF